MDIGAELRAAREAKGLSDRCVRRAHARARTDAGRHRANDQSALPPQPFARGFVRTYAEELDLDPERVVRESFAQFPAEAAARSAPRSRVKSPDASWQPPSRWMGMATAVAILLVVVTAAVVLGRRGESARRARHRRHDRQRAGLAAPARGACTSRLSRPRSQQTRLQLQLQRRTSAAISIVLSMSRPCWVSATVDGRRAIYRILQPGERETLAAERDIAIRFGDAGAVTWTINGRDPGRRCRGAVRDVEDHVENAGTVK